MSGHSKWSQIKHKKGITDQKRSKLFSKLAKIISIVAKNGADPASNPQLQSAIEQARKINMPNENIARAIKRASDKNSSALYEITIHVIAPFAVSVIIEAITDNKNRTVGELKTIMSKHGVKMAGEGSLDYMFDKIKTEDGMVWQAKYPITIDDAQEKEKIKTFLSEIDDHDDVSAVYSNLADDN